MMKNSHKVNYNLKNKMKMILLSFIAFTLIGCSEVTKVTNIEIKEVDATVEYTNYTPMWLESVLYGQSMMSVTHLETYTTKLKYNKISYYLNDPESYKYCKDKKEVKCEFNTTYYQDGNSSTDIKKVIKE